MLTNKANGKKYVGQTVRKLLRERMSAHKNAHKSLKARGCRLLNNAIRKYGWDAFSVSILAASDSRTELNKLEEDMIDQHKTLYPTGYNILQGASQAPMTDPMTKAKLTATLQKPEVKRKLSLGVKRARANLPDAEKKKWVQNVREAQTTPAMQLL